MSRGVMAALAVLGLAVAFVVCSGSAPGPARMDSARARTATPLPSGSLRIRGVVLGNTGPVAGVRVSASRPEPGQTLTELPCSTGKGAPARRPEEGPRLMDCLGNDEEQVVALVSEGKGEAPEYAEALTSEDGTFELEGLPEGRFTLWALDAQGAALRAGIPAGMEGVELRLDGGVVLEGAVGSEDGPLAGARVTAVHTKHARFFDARTGPDGRFRIGPLPDMDCALIVTAEGWRPAIFLSYFLQSSPDSVMTLSRPKHLAGRVLTPEGAPSPGTRVRRSSSAFHRDGFVQETTTDAEGRFTFGPLDADDDYRLEAEREGRFAFTFAEVPRKGVVREAVLTLGGALVVEGTVRDEASRPLPGAEVRLSSPDDPFWYWEDRTGPDGRYRLGPLPSGSYGVSVQALRYRTLSLPERRVEVGMGPVDFKLSRTVSIEGRIVDSDGRPVSDAPVELVRPGVPLSRFSFEARTVSDEEGRFLLDIEQPGDYLLRIEPVAFLPELQPVHAPATGVQVVLRRGAVVSGTLADELGLPVHHASVTLWGEDATEELHRSTRTDKEGRFALGGLYPGRYVLEATSIEDSLSRRVSRPLALEADARAEVALRLEAGWTLGGRVVDGRGQPVARAEVRAMVLRQDTPSWRNPDAVAREENAPSEGVRTGPDGRFTLRHLVAGTYDVRVTKEALGCVSRVDESWSGCVRVGRGTTEALIELGNVAAIRGRLVGPDGTPITFFTVGGRTFQNPNGRFSLPVSDSDTFDFHIDVPGMVSMVREVETRMGEDLNLGILRMEQARGARVRVVDAKTSAPVLDADVRARSLVPGAGESDLLLDGCITREDGTCELLRLPSRPVVLTVKSPLQHLTRQVTLAPDAQEVTVSLDAGARIEVRVRNAQGLPQGATLHFSSGSDSSTVNVANGHAVVRSLPPGDYEVELIRRFSARRATLHPGSVRVPASGGVVLTFKVEPEPEARPRPARSSAPPR